MAPTGYRNFFHWRAHMKRSLVMAVIISTTCSAYAALPVTPPTTTPPPIRWSDLSGTWRINSSDFFLESGPDVCTLRVNRSEAAFSCLSAPTFYANVSRFGSGQKNCAGLRMETKAPRPFDEAELSFCLSKDRSIGFGLVIFHTSYQGGKTEGFHHVTIIRGDE